MFSYTLIVVEIRRETTDTLTLCFKQPALRKIKYKAGQYLSLIFRINGKRYVRPYSFSSTPVVDPLIEVTIKRVANGIVSNHIHDQVKIGDALEVMEPMGDFIFEPRENIEEVFFWGAGSGITPLISLIKEVLTSKPSIRVNLVYGNRGFDTIIYSQLLTTLLVSYPERFKVWHFLTQLTFREDNPYIVEGRINKDYAFNILKDVDSVNTMHYICGPTGLKESVKAALDDLKVSNENIYSEDFELTKDPKDFEDIHTQIINLKFKNAEYSLEVTKGKSILEAALDAGIEMPYSCQTGNCSTCKGICISGELKMVGLTKDRIDLRKNEYLLCCSHPLTDNISLSI